MGIDEGVMLVIGGFGKLEGLDIGYYVWLIVFVVMFNDSYVVWEEIFGFVFVILFFVDEVEVVRIVNDMFYGFVVYV